MKNVFIATISLNFNCFYNINKVNNKIKIVFIIDCIYGVTGGTENQLLKLVQNLNHEKYEIHIISLMNTHWLSNNTQELKCKLHVVNYDITNHKRFKNTYAIIKLTKTIKKIAPDIVMCFFRASCILGAMISYFCRVQVITTTRRDFGEFYSRAFLNSMRITNRFSHAIVVNSYPVKYLVVEKEKIKSQKVHVIHNGIKIDSGKCRPFEKSFISKKALGIKDNQKVIGIVAGLRPMKRHTTFLLAAKEVIAKRKDVEFLIVGDGPERMNLEKLSHKLRLQNHLKFVGWQSKIFGYLEIFDIGINCSQKEGLSNAIMEYMAYGVPCIVSDSGGNKDLIEHGEDGFTFELDNYRRLSEYILILLDNEKIRDKYIFNARIKIINKFSLDTMVKKYDNLFVKLTNKGKQ